MSRSDFPQATLSFDPSGYQQSEIQALGWITFEQMLQRLHKEGVYIHPEQLATFLVFHGLPVNLRYVPHHLQQKAIAINANYQGDMVQLVEERDELF